MKYLAILWDSLREALDAKVIYFLMGLSGLVILGFASLSFRPEPASKGIESILQRFPGAQARGFGARVAPPLHYDIDHFEQVNDTSRPWEGEYRFDLMVTETPPPPGEDEGPKPKQAERPSLFRLAVLLAWLQQRNPEELTKEEREARQRAGFLLLQAQQDPGALSKTDRKRLEEAFAAEIKRVTPAQMERYVKNQFASRGTLEVTDVKLREGEGKPGTDEGKKYRFTVEAKARPETVRTWPHTLVLFFGALPLPGEMPVGPLVFGLEAVFINWAGAGVAMLISTVITAFFIPNMLRKGSIDLLLAKPVYRSVLLVYKFIGGLAFMLLNTVVIVAGVWLVLGLRSGLWGTGFLLSIFVLTFEFAIFYSVSTLFAVLTRSPIICILMACLTWVALWLSGLFYGLSEQTKEIGLLPHWANVTAETVHFVLPRYKDLDALNTRLVAGDLLPPDSVERKASEKEYEGIKWGESLAFTGGFIALMVGLACWRFATKDY